MKKWGFWTEEKLKEDALKYQSKGDWKRNSGHAYSKSRELGLLDKLTHHMTPRKKPNGYWTKIRVIEESKKYSSIKQWQNKSPSSYSIAIRDQYLSEITQNFIKLKKTVKHCPLFLKGLKICSICLKTKDTRDFGRSQGNSQGLKPGCKACLLVQSNEYRNANKEKQRIQSRKRRIIHPEVSRNNSLKSNYGITIADYDKMFEKQKGNCKICSINQSELKRNMSVDHCHSTGKVRALLCDKCNRGLGHFNDDPVIMSFAIKYLKSHK